MQVRMADAAIGDFDPHILRADIAAIEGKGGKGLVSRMGGKAGASEHGSKSPFIYKKISPGERLPWTRAKGSAHAMRRL
jgi:hypothetical protein